MDALDTSSRPPVVILTGDPSAVSVVFRSAPGYKAPKTEPALYIWRKRMLIEATTGLINLEPWEKVVISENDVLIALYLAVAVVVAIPLCLAYTSLPPVLAALIAWFARVWDFVGYCLTYPGLFVRIDDSMPLEEMKQYMSRNITNAF